MSWTLVLAVMLVSCVTLNDSTFPGAVIMKLFIFIQMENLIWSEIKKQHGFIQYCSIYITRLTGFKHRCRMVMWKIIGKDFNNNIVVPVSIQSSNTAWCVCETFDCVDKKEKMDRVMWLKRRFKSVSYIFLNKSTYFIFIFIVFIIYYFFTLHLPWKLSTNKSNLEWYSFVILLSLFYR